MHQRPLVTTPVHRPGLPAGVVADLQRLEVAGPAKALPLPTVPAAVHCGPPGLRPCGRGEVPGVPGLQVGTEPGADSRLRQLPLTTPQLRPDLRPRRRGHRMALVMPAPEFRSDPRTRGGRHRVTPVMPSPQLRGQLGPRRCRHRMPAVMPAPQPSGNLRPCRRRHRMAPVRVGPALRPGRLLRPSRRRHLPPANGVVHVTAVDAPHQDRMNASRMSTALPRSRSGSWPCDCSIGSSSVTAMLAAMYLQARTRSAGIVW